jgi:hypothetical protein
MQLYDKKHRSFTKRIYGVSTIAEVGFKPTTSGYEFHEA